VSFAWRNRRLRVGAGGRKKPIGCDNSIQIPEENIEENHDDGMNVLYLDTSVEWMKLSDLKKDPTFQEGGLEEWLAKNNLGI